MTTKELKIELNLLTTLIKRVNPDCTVKCLSDSKLTHEISNINRVDVEPIKVYLSVLKSSRITVNNTTSNITISFTI